MNQSELEASACYWRQAREKNVRARASRDWLVWVLLLIGRESGVRFFNQSQSEVKQNQSKTRITFDTQLKTALWLDANLVKLKQVWLLKRKKYLTSLPAYSSAN